MLGEERKSSILGILLCIEVQDTRIFWIDRYGDQGWTTKDTWETLPLVKEVQDVYQ